MIHVRNMAGSGREMRCRKAVIKLGSHVVIGSDHRVDSGVIDSLADAIAALRARRVEVIIVSSGAIAIACRMLGRPHPKTLPEKQALAAIGQISLMLSYREALAARGLAAAQLLLTRGDIEDRRRYLNARYTIERLLKLGAVPIINENDTTATDEITFGDNDMLSAYIAVKMKADLLALLSSVDGVYEKPPRGRGAGRVIPVIEKIDEAIYERVDNGRSAHGTGGMRTKLDAAATAAAAGVHTVIANGKRPGIVEEIFSERFEGTYFPPSRRASISARRRWIGFANRSHGRRLALDRGAVRAIVEENKSLLPVGVAAVEGEFSRGDVVDLCDEGGRTIARGLANYSSQEIEKIRGRRTSEIKAILGERRYDEIVHRDNLTLL